MSGYLHRYSERKRDQQPRRRIGRRGDDIPSVSEYAHWNEDAQAMWYEENKYDMAHADEIIDDGEWEGPDDFDDE